MAWVTGAASRRTGRTRGCRRNRAAAPAHTRADSSDGYEDQVRMYLREIGTVPLLTWDGEKRLARAMEAGNYLQDVIRPHVQAGRARKSVPSLYRELYRRLRAVYRFALADARIDTPSSWTAGTRCAALRAMADIQPEHLRGVAQLVEAPLDETERALLEVLDHQPRSAGRDGALVRRTRRRRASCPMPERFEVRVYQQTPTLQVLSRRAGTRSRTSRIVPGAT